MPRAEQITAARYVVCTMLDEAASRDTPWGAGVWARQSLLVMFHNETWGGEKVFQLLARLAQKPAQHRICSNCLTWCSRSASKAVTASRTTAVARSTRCASGSLR